MRCRANSNGIHWNPSLRQSRAVRSFRTEENRYAIGHLFVRRDLLVFAFRPCAICWAHAPRSCGKTDGGTSARATEECSRPSACDHSVAVDVGCRSCEAPANSARTSVGNPRLLHKIQHGSTFTPETIYHSRCRSDSSSRRGRIRNLAVSTRAIFGRDRTIDRGFAFRKPERRQSEYVLRRGHPG